jgi:hypothetical protein
VLASHLRVTSSNERHGSAALTPHTCTGCCYPRRPSDTGALLAQEFFFPGYPAPPVKLIVQLCVSVEAWLKRQQQQDQQQPPAVDGAAAGTTTPSGDGGGSRGAAAPHGSGSKSSSSSSSKREGPAVLFHCKTGKGRTTVAIACLLVGQG